MCLEEARSRETVQSASGVLAVEAVSRAKEGLWRAEGDADVGCGEGETLSCR